MKKLFPFLKPYRGAIGLSLLMTVISCACALLLPTVMSEILNQGIYLSDLGYVLRSSALMFAISLAELASVVAGQYFSAKTVNGFCADLRAAVFGKVNRMTFEEISEIGSSGLLSRTTHDVETLAWIVGELAQSALSIPILFFGGVILCFLKDVTLSLIFLCFLPVIFLTVILIGRKVEPLWKISDDYTDIQNELVRERLHGIRVIRAFNREPYEQSRIEEATHTMARYIIRGNVSMDLIWPLAMMLLNIAAVLMAYVGGARMQSGSGSLSGGDMFAIIQYVGLATGGILSGSFAVVMLPHSKVAAGRIGEVLSAAGMEAAEEGGSLREPFRGGFRLEHLSFGYDGADTPALSDISMEVRPGEKVALIGGTGSGKSTLVQLLLGFRRPGEGSLFFDGTDTAELSAAEMRRGISAVLQKSAIFSGTVRENVELGFREDETLTPEERERAVTEALAAAQILDFVEEQPLGLDTVLEQAGRNLSGGQKQRICIARALVRKAPLFILDDSFSALDFLTEARLTKALGELEAREETPRTRLVITQRVSTARRCDRIYVLDEGRLVGEGTHEELLAACQVYREICLSQEREVQA